MQLHFGLERCAAQWKRAVGCVGTFDGLHLGHRKVLQTAVAAARAESVPCVLVTFDRHPAALLAPERCPPSLAGLRTNLRCIREEGVDVAVVLAFDADLSRLTAQQFLDSVLRDALKVERMVVGHDFAFGHGREGTPAWLAERLPTEVVPALELGGKRVSSSAIRAAVSRGDVSLAGELLGRPFALEGVVVRGEQLGRRETGIVHWWGRRSSTRSVAGGRLQSHVDFLRQLPVGSTTRPVRLPMPNARRTHRRPP